MPAPLAVLDECAHPVRNGADARINATVRNRRFMPNLPRPGRFPGGCNDMPSARGPVKGEPGNVRQARQLRYLGMAGAVPGP